MYFPTSGYLPALWDLISLRDKMHPGLVVLRTIAPLGYTLGKDFVIMQGRRHSG